MTIEDEIASAQSFADDPPPNESSTGEWVIPPLLWAAGYDRRDIVSRVADSMSQFPDYTVLPNHPTSAFYVEAKAWNVALVDIHVQQALNYANQNGKRFAVLTNGREWRLYDNAIQSELSLKLIATASLVDPDQILHFVTLVSKSKVVDGSLENLATPIYQLRLQQVSEALEQKKRDKEGRVNHQRQIELRSAIDSTLPALLADEDNDIVDMIATALRRTRDFELLSNANLCAWFGDWLRQPSADEESEASESVGESPPRNANESDALYEARLNHTALWHKMRKARDVYRQIHAEEKAAWATRQAVAAAEKGK